MKNNQQIQHCNACVHLQTTGSRGFHITNYLAGENIPTFCSSINRIFFILKGSVSVTCGLFEDIVFSENEAGFFPKTIDRHAVAITDCKILIMSMPNFGSICGSQVLHRFYNYAKNTEWHFKPVSTNLHIRKFIESIEYYASTDTNCTLLHRCKEVELVLLFKRTYTLQDIVPIIQPIVGHEQQFRDFILDNYRHARSVTDLAKMSGMNMTSFTGRFKAEFGETPLIWIQKKKVEAIQYKIKYTDCTVGDLVNQFDFSSGSDFVKFSKRHFGSSPTMLINKLRNLK